MQFQRNTSTSRSSSLMKTIIIVVLIFLLFGIAIVLFNQIDFPSPNKLIEKIIPNENLKIVK